MLNQPLISLITVSYNAIRTVESAICSVAEQDYPALEYILIDGASTDGTLAVAKQYEEHFAGLVSEPDRGIYDAMNKGVKRARGEWIGMVNADDFLEPGALRKVAEFAEKYPEATVLHGQVRIWDEKGAERHVLTCEGQNYERRFHQMPAWHPATFIRRDCYERVGLYDLQYRGAADYEFLLRALEGGEKFQPVPFILSNMRVGGFSTSEFLTSQREKRQVRLRYGCPFFQAWGDFLFQSLSVYLRYVLLKDNRLYQWYRSKKQAGEKE